MKRDPYAWRRQLDPRDPDYLPPRDPDDEDFEPRDYTDAELACAAAEAENHW